MSELLNKQDWMTTKWRPMMAITYMLINICDFIVFPVMFTIVQLVAATLATGRRVYPSGVRCHPWYLCMDTRAGEGRGC